PKTAEAPKADAAAPAPEKPAEPAPGAAAPAPDERLNNLKKLADDFWHYGRVARYDLAAEAGKQILASGAAPQEIMAALNAAAQERKDDVSSRLLQWQQIDAMKDVTTQLMTARHQG